MSASVASNAGHQAISAAAEKRRSALSVGLLLLLLVLTTDVIFMPSRIIRSDAAVWREEALSLINHGTLSIDPAMANLLDQPKGKALDFNPADGRWYSKYGVANSIMSIPPLLINERPGVLLLNLWNIILTLALASTLFVTARRYAANPWLCAAYVLAVLYGTFLWFYHRAQTGEIYQVLFFSLMYESLLRGVQRPLKIGTGMILLAWLFLAILVLTRVFFAVLIPVVMAVLLLVAIRRRAPLVRSGLLIMTPPALMLAILAWINDVKFGSPFLTGYHQWRPEEHLPVGPISDGLRGMLFSAHWSLFIYFPPLLISIWGTLAFCRRYTIDAILAFGSFLVSLLLLSKIPTWRGEWTYGPRYMIFVLPIVCMPALLVVQRWKKATALAAILILIPSVLAQFEVNGRDFWLFYDVYHPLEPIADSQITDYFYGRPEAVLYYQLESNRDHLQQMPIFQHIRAKAPAAKLPKYMTIVHKALRDTNFYWWPQSAAGGGSS